MSARRSRLKRAVKRVSGCLDEIPHLLLVLKNFEKRERGSEKFTGAIHGFCEDKYITF